MSKQELYIWLLLKRFQSGLTHKQLASQVGLISTCVTRIYRGYDLGDADKVEKILTYFGTSSEALGYDYEYEGNDSLRIGVNRILDFFDVETISEDLKVNLADILWEHFVKMTYPT